MLTVYVFHLIVARSIFIWFGCIGFGMVYLKEELVRLVLKSKLAQSQYKRRFILVGTEREIAKMRKELAERTDESVEIVAELNLLETPVQQIVSMLHHYSVYGVLLSAKHTYFEQVEYVIRACELEGSLPISSRPRYPGPALTNCLIVLCWFSVQPRKLRGKASSNT